MKPHGALNTAVAEASRRARRGDRRRPTADVRRRAADHRHRRLAACTAPRERLGQPVVAEGFPDRGYAPDGSLAKRGTEGAIIHDADAGRRSARSGWRMDGTVEALDGTVDRARPRHALHPRRQPGQRRDRAGDPRRARARGHRHRRLLSAMAPVGQYLRYSTVFDEQANLRVLALAATLDATRPDGVREIYPGYGSVYVEWEDRTLSNERATRVDRRGARSRPRRPRATPAEITVPVSYGGLDTDEVAEQTGLSPERDRRAPRRRRTTASAPARPSASR